MTDCIKGRPAAEQAYLYEKMATLAPVDLVQFLKQRNICDQCVIYYQLSSLFILYKNSNVGLDLLHHKIAVALSNTYGAEHVEEAYTDTSPKH